MSSILTPLCLQKNAYFEGWECQECAHQNDSFCVPSLGAANLRLLGRDWLDRGSSLSSMCSKELP